MSGWSTLKGDVGDCVGTSSTRDVDGQRGPSFSLEIAARRRGEKRTPQRNGGGGRETGRWKSEHARKRKRKGRKVFYLLINTPSRHFKQLTGVKLCPRRPLRPGVPRASRALWGAGLVGQVPLWGYTCVAPGFRVFDRIISRVSRQCECDFLHPIDALEKRAVVRSGPLPLCRAPRVPRSASRSGQLRVCTQCSSTAAHSEQC